MGDVALAAGLIFGVGLTMADMVNPARVQAFLDPFGAWDPTLALVMGGAIIPMLIAWRLTEGARPMFGTSFPPLKREIDGRLIFGSALFGGGWGLAGFCPGPALAALSFGGAPVLIFVAAMFAGMSLHDLWPQSRAVA